MEVLKPKEMYRPLFGGKYPAGGLPCPTIEQSRYDGYITGRDWDQFYPRNKYVPGGPYVSTTGYNSHDSDWKAYCHATSENLTAWLEGFHLGRKDFQEILKAYEEGEHYKPPAPVIKLAKDECLPNWSLE